jgi:hypothetical protein
MRKIPALLVTIFLVASTCSFAQWSITGNNTTDSSTNFLGTTNLRPIMFRTNNVFRMKIVSNGNVLIGTTTDQQSSLLTLEATNKGFLVPRMTQAQRTTIGSPVNGLQVFQTDGAPGFYVYQSGVWRRLFSEADGNMFYSANGTLTSNRFVDLGTATLSIGKAANANFHLFNNGRMWIGSGTPIDGGFQMDVAGTVRLQNEVTLTNSGINRSGVNGAYSVVFGHSGFPAIGSGDNAVAIGTAASSTGIDNISIGTYAAAGGNYSIAIGRGVNALTSEFVVGQTQSAIQTMIIGTSRVGVLNTAGNSLLFTTSPANGLNLNGGGPYNWSWQSNRYRCGG